ncbi:MAG: hypothetical protein ABJ081_05245 [Hyphomicrobiales bacterium]
MRPYDESGEVAEFHRLNAEVRGKYNINACFGLGRFYKEGRGGLRRDGLKAKSWFTRCLSVSTDKPYKYIHEFLENKEITYLGTESEARKILPKNYNEHQVSALVELYWIDKNTRDLDEIFDIAFRAKGGDAEAQYELGDLFMHASDQYFIPVIVRQRDGCEWMKKAAEQGYSKAYMPLALYYSGADLPRYAHDKFLDKDAALYWAERAAKYFSQADDKYNRKEAERIIEECYKSNLKVLKFS